MTELTSKGCVCKSKSLSALVTESTGCPSVCVCVCVSVCATDESIAKILLREKLKDIGLRFSIFFSEMVENHCAEKNIGLVFTTHC